MERILKLCEINLSVDKVLNIAKTIVSLRFLERKLLIVLWSGVCIPVIRSSQKYTAH